MARTGPRSLKWRFAQPLPEKDIYTFGELFDHLPMPLNRFRKMAEISHATIYGAQHRTRISRQSLQAILSAFSRVYERYLTTENVINLPALVPELRDHRVFKAPKEPLPEKETYTFQELLDYLPMSRNRFARMSRKDNALLKAMAQGKSVRVHTLQEVLSAFSHVYNRSLTAENVTDLPPIVSQQTSIFPLEERKKKGPLPEKEEYTLQELFEYLPIPFRTFYTYVSCSHTTVLRVFEGRPVRVQTMQEILVGLSRVYERPFSLENVKELPLRKKKVKEPRTREEPPSLPDKQFYTINELFEYLPLPLRRFSRVTHISVPTLMNAREKKPLKPQTARFLLDGFSRVYNRPFSLENVYGVVRIPQAEKKPVLKPEYHPLPEKEMYTLEELFAHLPMSLFQFANENGISYEVSSALKKGKNIRDESKNAILAAFSRVYDRPLNYSNVVGILQSEIHVPMQEKEQVKESIFPEKPSYSIEELVDWLPFSQGQLAKNYGVQPTTIKKLRAGIPIMELTARLALEALSRIYQRPLTFGNVTGIKLSQRWKQGE